MATANYMTMENFPLFVKEFNTQIKRCPACGLYQDCENFAAIIARSTRYVGF